MNLLQRCLHHHQKLLLLYGGKLPFYFILFMYRLYNPLAVGNKRAVKESNEVKTDAEVKAIKEKCERMELDFEVNGTVWNENEGVVLFNLEDVW